MTVNDRLYAAWVLVVVCGLRRGELAGLKWLKVDLEGGAIHVHWQRSSASGVIAGGVVEKEPVYRVLVSRSALDRGAELCD